MTLECYKKMYAILCGAVSDAIDLIDGANSCLDVKNHLQKALMDAEDIYLEWDE